MGDSKIIFWIGLAVVVLGVMVYVSNQNPTIQDLNNANAPIGNTPEISNNAPNLPDNVPTAQEDNSNYPKWNQFPISYYFTNGNICGDYELNRVRWAFRAIQNETYGKISFRETNNSGDINVVCSKDYETGSAPGTYTSGEGGYNSRGNEIVNGTIYLLHMGGGKFTGGCINLPNVEIHEIMHTFGLVHSEDPHSIMYPISGSNICVLKHIDSETIGILNSIYHFE